MKKDDQCGLELIYFFHLKNLLGKQKPIPASRSACHGPTDKLHKPWADAM